MFILAVLIAVIILVKDKAVSGDSLMDIEDYDFSEVQEVLDENDYREVDFFTMIKEVISGDSDTVILDTVKYMADKAFANVNVGKECIVNIILISLFSAFFSNFAKVFSGNGVSDSGFYVCYIAVMTLSLTIFSIASEIAVNLLELILEFMRALIPAFFLSVGMIGQTSAMGFYQITLVVIFCVNYIFLNVVMPALKIYLIMAMANNISKEDLLSKMINLIKKGIVFLNRSLLGVVLGINILQGLVLPHVDGVKNTTIRKLAGTIPVVGDSSEYVTDVFLGSGLLIKNSLGTVAIIVIFCLCFVPILKLFIINISLQISSAVVQPIADNRIVESISYVGESVKLMLRTVMTTAVLFVITIALVCVMTNIK